MILDRILYRKKIVQQAQDILSGEYRHFQCYECGLYWPSIEGVVSSFALCMTNIWTEEYAEKNHNRWRDCKYFRRKINWPHPSL